MLKNTRRTFLSNALTALATTVAVPLVSFVKPPVKPLPSLSGRKILFTYGGWDGHEPNKFVDFLLPWMKSEGASITLSETLDVYTDKDIMDHADLVVQIFTMSKISKEQEAGLLDAIKLNGTGMAGWHGGMCDAFRDNPEYQYMTGGQWASHPGGVIEYEVNIRDHEDAVTQGLKDFKMKSEQYFMHVDPNVKVLATTRFTGDHDAWIDGCVMPVCWKKTYGKGRIFYTSLGHNLSHVTERPEADAILKRGIQWASASKYELIEKWVNPVYGTSS